MTTNFSPTAMKSAKATSTTTTSTKTTQPQLLLVTNDLATNSPWKLDEETRETGRRGLEKARAALRATRPAHLDVAA